VRPPDARSRIASTLLKDSSNIAFLHRLESSALPPGICLPTGRFGSSCLHAMPCDGSPATRVGEVMLRVGLCIFPFNLPVN
jgi:hypothetical protein